MLSEEQLGLLSRGARRISSWSGGQVSLVAPDSMLGLMFQDSVVMSVELSELMSRAEMESSGELRGRERESVHS